MSPSLLEKARASRVSALLWVARRNALDDPLDAADDPVPTLVFRSRSNCTEPPTSVRDTAAA